MNTVYIALGSNLGNRSANINAALEAIKRLEGTALMQMSDVLETDPVGPPGQGKYLNAVAEISTSLRPHGL
ncbi:MAG TPA: 2-amino-4-hydroxy-6-hydroxymethyldihydropteridine diphosphokinase, partial [Phycisphaerales bacterium]|nr:2-amino-4-hydroxy-6-hydroxymethyldihydropteridine diphosphokinase [Phycisphaerales bacterium]